MKVNFLVSAHQNAFIPGARRLFVIDPYIAHVLEREGRISEYDEVQVADASRVTRDEFIFDHKFVDQKYHKYTAILVRRLDELHNTCHGASFWKKALSLAILRHVSFCYELFKVCEANFNPEHHDLRVLDQSSYHIPVDFDDHRRIFQNTNFGQEQLFSIYCGLFYPGQFKSWEDSLPLYGHGSVPSGGQSRSLLRKYTLRGIVHWLLRLPRGLARKFLHIRSPRVGVMDAYFSHERRNQLTLESLGRIQTIPLPEIPSPISDIEWEHRDKLVANEADFDRFDKFVFACLKYGMPKFFVEDFQYVYKHTETHFKRYKNLRWIVCEGWIGYALSSFSLAVLRQLGVKHIYNEHNYLAHPFLGNNLKYLLPLVDEFASLGWKDSSIRNLVCGASLFQWVDGESSVKEHDLLFISSIPNTRAPEVNASYGESGARVVPGYLEMNHRFFETLEESTLAAMVYRAYPARVARQVLAWDQAFILREFLSKVKVFDDTATSARFLMQRSRLTVINYLSTTYLEALLADVPTIILWNQESYLLEDRYTDFFDELIEVKICHTDPVEAARFVEKIKSDPEAWWRSPAVRRAREAFLSSNIGSPEVLVRHLIDRANEHNEVVN